MWLWKSKVRLCHSQDFWRRISSGSSGVFTRIIHALRIKSRPPIAPLLNARHPITANSVSAMGTTGVMVGHPRFQERGESGINRRTSVSAGPRGPETEDAWGYKLCIGPQCTATENERTAKRIQAPVWITESKDSDHPQTGWSETGWSYGRKGGLCLWSCCNIQRIYIYIHCATFLVSHWCAISQQQNKMSSLKYIQMDNDFKTTFCFTNSSYCSPPLLQKSGSILVCNA